VEAKRTVGTDAGTEGTPCLGGIGKLRTAAKLRQKQLKMSYFILFYGYFIG
jgi:hypothetical protein